MQREGELRKARDEMEGLKRQYHAESQRLQHHIKVLKEQSEA